MIRASLASLVFCAACGEPRIDPVQHTTPPSTPKLTMLVSNQSFDLDPVDIRIEVDDTLAISGDFVVENQHTWVPFELDVGPGTHTLRVTTSDADTAMTQSFEMDDRKWGVVMFWFHEDGPEPTPPHFSWSLHDTQPAFD